MPLIFIFLHLVPSHNTLKFLSFSLQYTQCNSSTSLYHLQVLTHVSSTHPLTLPSTHVRTPFSVTLILVSHCFLSSSKNNPKSLLTFLTLLVLLLLLLLLSVPCQSVHGVFPCLVCPPVITAPPTQHGKLKKMLVWLCTCDLRHGWGVCGKEWNIFTFPTQDMVVTSVNVKDSKQ